MEWIHNSLGLGATGGGFFLGVWPVASGAMCLKRCSEDNSDYGKIKTRTME